MERSRGGVCRHALRTACPRARRCMRSFPKCGLIRLSALSEMPRCQSLVIHPTHAARHGRRTQSFFGLSATMASVVTRRPATEPSSCRATLTT